MLTVSGSVAVVTGASSGIGRAVALELAAADATVVALARREARLVELVETLRRSTPASGYVVCDVRDIDRYVAVLAEVERDHGRIDVLVNNAGISEPDGDGLAPYRALMETNYFAAVAGTLAVLPGMRARRCGVVVNVSSDSGRAPTPGEPGYSASKAAVSAFTEALSFETEADDVWLHVLYPGWVPTEMTEPDGREDPHRPPRMVRRTPEQVARLVVHGLGTRRLELDATRVARVACRWPGRSSRPPTGRACAPPSGCNAPLFSGRSRLGGTRAARHRGSTWAVRDDVWTYPAHRWVRSTPPRRTGSRGERTPGPGTDPDGGDDRLPADGGVDWSADRRGAPGGSRAGDAVHGLGRAGPRGAHRGGHLVLQGARRRRAGRRADARAVGPRRRRPVRVVRPRGPRRGATRGASRARSSAPTPCRWGTGRAARR